MHSGLRLLNSPGTFLPLVGSSYLLPSLRSVEFGVIQRIQKKPVLHNLRTTEVLCCKLKRRSAGSRDDSSCSLQITLRWTLIAVRL
jgi:hypothetical protein